MKTDFCPLESKLIGVELEYKAKLETGLADYWDFKQMINLF